MIMDLLKTRHSVRKFQDKPIPDNIVQEILEAGRLSPSGGNEQPWRFGVITNCALIAKIAGAAYQQTWIAKAPLLVVLCTVIVADARGARDIQKHRFPHYAEIIDVLDKGLYSALNAEEHQTKIAGTHIALVAWEYGVGSTWVSRFDVKAVQAILGLPADCIPSELLVMGYPEKLHKPTPKKPLDKIVFYDTFSG